jgi:hypothetical protein
MRHLFFHGTLTSWQSRQAKRSTLHGLLALLTLASPAAASDLWLLRTEGPRPVLVHRDTADRQVDDRLRLVCARDGRLIGEVPLARLQEQGPVTVVRLAVGRIVAQAPAERRETSRGAVLRFRIAEGGELIAALDGAREIRLAILRVTYTLPVPDPRPLADFRAACGGR